MEGHPWPLALSGTLLGYSYASLKSMAITYSFIHLFDKYWPGTLSLSGTPLDAADIMINKSGHNPGLQVFTAWRGGRRQS